MKNIAWATILLAITTITLLWATTALGQLVELEQQAMSDTFQYAMENNPTSRAADWINPDTKHAGAVVPVRSFSNSQGLPCREFITTITIGGEQQQGYGTACRQPDGTWQIVNDDPANQASAVASRPAYLYQPAERYYVYPHAYYNPYRIYFSFSWLFHGGRLHVGNYYPGVSRWHDLYYRHPHKYRHYKPLPHHRWYRRDHIRRSWNRPARIYRDRHIYRDRNRIERNIHRRDGRIEKHIHSDRGRTEQRIYLERGRSERRIEQNRNRGERQIHRR